MRGCDAFEVSGRRQPLILLRVDYIDLGPEAMQQKKKGTYR